VRFLPWLALLVCGFLFYLGVSAWNRPTRPHEIPGTRHFKWSDSPPPPQVVVIQAPERVTPSSSPEPTIAPGGLSPTALFSRRAPAVVVVKAVRPDGIAQGSGVVLGESRVVTNRHVVDGASQVTVLRGDQEFLTRSSKSSPLHDIAIIEVSGFSSVAIPVRTANTLQVGERVYAIGAPKGLELTLSEGLISALRPYEGGLVIQTTAPVSHGSSGGGLFDTEGNLIGITTFGVLDGQNLNFALPIEWASNLDSPGIAPASSTTATSPPSRKTEEQIERERAEAVYRPRMVAAAPMIRQLGALNRRYHDACYGQSTVTVHNGFGENEDVTSGQGNVGRHEFGWTSVRNQTQHWREVSAVDNATMPQCRIIVSDIHDLLGRIGPIMEDAEREAVRQSIWTWLQRDVPEKLAAELWP